MPSLITFEPICDADKITNEMLAKARSMPGFVTTLVKDGKLYAVLRKDDQWP